MKTLEHITKSEPGYDCIKFECINGDITCIPGKASNHTQRRRTPTALTHRKPERRDRMKNAEFGAMWDKLVDAQFGSNSKRLDGVTEEEFDAAIISDDEEALPTGRRMLAHEEGGTEYHQCMIIRGAAVVVYWIFDADEIEEAVDDDSNLDWSMDNVDRITYA